jgi:hypothetical protein
MSREIKKIDYADEIITLQNRAAQCVTELVGIADDLKYVGPAIAQLKAKSDNPDELPVLLRKVKLASENLDRAEALLSERRSTIAELLK